MVSEQYSPREYQKQFTDSIINRKKVYGMIDLGYGKTAATLSAIEQLFADIAIKGVLVVAPLEVAKLTWPTEIKKWSEFSWMSSVLIHGSPAVRFRALTSKANIFIINYENIVWLCDILKTNSPESWPFDMVVFDESTKLKAVGTKRFKAWKGIAGHFKYVVNLSGTPRPNSSLDLWAQIYLMDQGESLGKGYESFKFEYGTRCDREGYVWTVGKCKEEMIYSKIRHLTYTVPKHLENKKLPSRTHDVVCPIPDKRHYKRLEDEGLLQINGEQQQFIAIAKLGKCMQYTGGAIYHSPEDRNYEVFHNAKMKLLKKLIKTLDNAIVVYSFQHEKERILKEFPQAVNFKSSDSARTMSDWNSGKIEVLLCHPASTGHGINLQYGGHNIIWYGLNWSYELYYQMIGRLLRSGQTKTVNVYRLIMADTIDEMLIEVLRHKEKGMDMLFEILTNYKNNK